MTVVLHPYDVGTEPEIREPTDFQRRGELHHVDRVFKAEITQIVTLTETDKLFHLRIVDAAERERFSFRPGQFVMLEVPGFGEVPISIASSPLWKGHLELCIRNAGFVTGALHKAARGALVGIRGPFGSSFPMAAMKGHDVLLIAGGLGLAPLRAPIFHVTDNRADYGDVHVLYGTRTPADLLFTWEYDHLRTVYDLKLSVIVEEGDAGWKGPVGRITALLDDFAVRPEKTFAIVCGPPVMFKFVCSRLAELGVPMQRMFVSLERRMHCGMGKCCRCAVGGTLTCLDGPVFDYWTAMNLKEAI
jgi:sulfhydrogenase subunit gamma (sulfur reductase)